MSARTQMCPHGRPSWRSCPHCLGINAAGEVSEPETVQATGANSGSLTPSSADDWATLEGYFADSYSDAETLAARDALGRLRERNEQLTEALRFWVDRADRFEENLPENTAYMKARGVLNDNYARGRALASSSSLRLGEPE